MGVERVGSAAGQAWDGQTERRQGGDRRKGDRRAADRRPPQGLLAMCEQTEELLVALDRALTHYDRAALDRAERLAREVHAAEGPLTASLLRTRWAFVPGHLERIGDYAETILRCARVVVVDGVPFSDKAVGEVGELMDRGAQLLRIVRDAVATRNRFLLDTLARKGSALAARAAAFAEAHESRLVEGVCAPRASSLFVAILDSLRGIEWHARQIGERLGGAAAG